MEGALSDEEAAQGQLESMDRFAEVVPDLPQVTGTLVLRWDVSAQGKVQNVRCVVNNLVVRPWSRSVDKSQPALQQVIQAAVQKVSAQQYAAKDGPSTITAPLTFE